MARTEARVLVSIWDDPDFLALSCDAQRVYMFLLSQADLAHTGVIPLRVRRWAQKAANLDTTKLGEALRELERARFIIADRNTEELLIRSFIRRDGVYLQPNLLRAARKQLQVVASPVLRAALAVELARVLPEAKNQAKAEVEAMLDDLAKTAPEPPLDPLPDPSANPSEMPTPMPLGARGVVTAVTTGSPYPLAPDPLAPEPLPLATLAAPPTAQDLIAEWITNCRTPPSRRTIGALSKQVKALLDERQDPEQVRAGIDLWRRKGADPSILHSFVNQVGNAEPRGSPNGRASPSTATLRAEAAIEAGKAARAMLEAKEITG